LEEALAYPHFLAVHASGLRWTIETSAFWFAVSVLTLAAWIVTYFSWRDGAQSFSAYLVFGYAVVMLVNVAVPHVPLAVWFRGYTPGLITAVTVNLPCIAFLLARALGERYVSRKKATKVSAVVMLGISTSIMLFFSAFARR
jgi:hypothetical protein